jgi:GTPase SAR1 family protein
LYLSNNQTYAINNRRSFDSLSHWLDDVKNFAKKEVVIAVVGTKCDLEEERVVTKEEGHLMASKINAIFY